MSTPELKLRLIERIARTDDLTTLRTVEHVLEPAAGAAAMPSTGGSSGVLRDSGSDVAYGNPAADEQTADDAVLGTRPDGTSVVAAEAAKGWNDAVQEVLNGGGHTMEEVLAHIRRRHREDGYA